MAIQTIGFAQLSLQAVAVDGMLEMTFRNTEEYLYRLGFCVTLAHRVNGIYWTYGTFYKKYGS